jgi:putative membrane protein insertion efficiency factor
MRRAVWGVGLPVRLLLLGLIGLYRKLISPFLVALLGPRCRFHPSCSAYAQEAIRVHGAARGLVLAGWRVLRCSPLTPGGLDPVPPRGVWPGPHPAKVYDKVIHPPGREA